VIVEPIAGNMGVVPPVPGFLEAIQTLTRETDALFICDEVITGFRVAPGGAQQKLGLEPGLTTLGKILGGGLPVGAFGGRRDVMEYIAPVGPVYQAGTLSGNPLAMAAGLAGLEALQTDGFYQALDDRTQQLASGLRSAAARAQIPVTVNAVTGMLTVFFAPGPINSLETAQRSDTGLYARFFHAMLERGVYLPPSQYEAWMLSAAHTEEIIAQTVEAAAEAFQETAGP
jgi:glutamate-1-semialdehyde 2,1-aminomutase